ncbi:ABC transporter ATP-binding protein [Bacillus sp. S/N-304-OC-R1]|uniref:ABC transporter ATP-binding protein n=1 Tax=Bacillus sp. S/N-304-OC-R1 TaxID=2758034 RepID=UPI001C8E1227|nr:ABC transporter ATP-binding protein [Bacillus sp. S/N-304-OC-R1]MBY0121854.1 ABC transporter ATP-binding protein [Bacillus sp. S/N-304-OC-R1]
MLNEFKRPFQYKKPFVLKQRENKPQRKEKAKTKNYRQTIKRLWHFLSNNKGLLFLVLLMVLISSVLGLLGPYLVGMSIDNYIVKKSTDGFFTLLIGLAGIYAAYSLSLWFQNYWMIGIAQNTVFEMRTKLFKHLHKLPIPFFDKRQHGELMSRITNDIENVSSTLNSSVIQIFSSILTLVGTVTVMLWLSPFLTLLTLVIVPLMFLGMKWITKRTGVLFKEQQKNLGELNGFIEETISGQRIIKTFSQENKVIQEFLEKGERLRGAGYWAQTYSGFIPKVMNFLNNLSFAIIAGIGGIFALKGWISIGVIVIFTEYARQFTRPLNDLANQFNTLLSAIAGAERVFEILDEDDEFPNESSLQEMPIVNGEVEFRQVSFGYEEDGNTIRNVNFHVLPGETAAFVGPTGAGKTTMINLLSRFYEVDSGEILIDGKPLTGIKKESLRKHMGFVLQDSFLFQGTVMENIRYGKLDASDNEVIKAAKMANAHSFIMRLPNGYNTLLNQDGNGISQGQKQLLSIARAFLANPSILILDEATSSIDTVTELKIQEALQELMKGRTSFVIAHRLNTIQNADRIFVLHEGKIIEEGTHQSLLKQKGFYFQLHGSKREAAKLGC